MKEISSFNRYFPVFCSCKAGVINDGMLIYSATEHFFAKT